MPPPFDSRFDFDADHAGERRATENSKWNRYPPDVIPMYVADMDFPSPPCVVEALERRVRHGFFGYGMEEPGFFDAITAWTATRYGWAVEPSWVVVLPGVIASFNLAIAALVEPGGGVLAHVPGYPPILAAPEAQGALRRDVALGRDPSGLYVHDAAAFAAAITPSTRAVLLCNPHNPTGRVFTGTELGAIADACLRNNILIFSDEIHCDLVFPPARHVPIASIGPEVAARTITFLAPSKTFNLPGLKTSLAIIPDADLRERFQAGKRNLVRAVNVLGYTAALAAYRDGGPWLDALLAYLRENRALVERFVANELPGVHMVEPEGTYMAWLDCNDAGLPGNDPASFFLGAAKVGLGDGANFGPGGAGFARLTFACPRPLLQEALERMAAALRSR